MNKYLLRLKSFSPYIYQIIIGSNNSIPFSQIIFHKTLILAMFFTAVGTIANVILNLGHEITYTTSGVLVFLIALYTISRFYDFYSVSLHLFVATLFTALNVAWFFNGGSFGPTLLIYQAFVPLFLLLTDIKFKKTIVFIFGINITILFIIEYQFGHLIIPYKNSINRLLDMYFVSLFFLIAEIPLIYTAYKKFLTQTEKAVQSDKIKSAFLANMSHEIRTPMNAIIGFADLLRDGNIDEESHNEYLDIIRDNGQILLQILNNVMDASKIESNMVELKIKVFSVRNIIERLFAAFSSQILYKENLELKLNIPDKHKKLAINSDELIVYQILSNLLTNAIKFTDKGQIQLGYTINKSTIKFFVKDTGSGIADDSKELIFKRFQQVDPSFKSDREGVGLGLSICQELSKKLNGTISLESEVGKGSTFFLSLPIDYAY